VTLDGLADRDGKEMDYYSAEAINLGYAWLALANLVLVTKNEPCWAETDDNFVSAIM
jgi:hypothetical protein